MPTTHDGHRRTRALGLDLFFLVLLGVVVFTATSLAAGGLPGYAPAAITAVVVLAAWAALSYRGTHPAHHGTHRAH
ncbi:hypothetical protein JGS22_018080 [Streptomyces sp. P38-E01]|uniref:Uncharacterized protein n=1 Tax=Streptomyces tardus TaxID=2780544 RepID=A0A949JIW2_9ACTN|nr:hypothetical protein [Streptomyces tardus]MBU7599475.1 hypothetical protein [Streptomyces tardus]